MYNDKKEPLLRIYNSLRNFIGENKVYKYGDVLCISTKNNDEYDKYITADGKSTFRELYGDVSDESDYAYFMVRKS